MPTARLIARHCSRRARVLIRRAASVALALMLAGATWPSRGTSLTQDDECYGFVFGRWTPGLDLLAAGHEPARSARHVSAPGGRDWAAALATGRDTMLILFPAWWPAGVHVHFPGGRRLEADTVRGTATALVADGRVRAPRTEVLAWRIPCRRPAATRP